MSNGCVLVLDDNPSRGQHISTLLKSQKWASVLSFNPDMALKILRSNRFHLMMMDSYVNGGNMLGHLDEFRSHAANTPMALMSDGPRDMAALKRALNGSMTDPADFVINKPFTKDGLKALLAETVKYHRERRSEQHVLIVENDVALRHKLASVFKQVGYIVSQAANMEDAMFDHNLGMVDVVVTAILIPGIGGIQGIAQLCKDYPHIRTIAMSEGVDEKVVAAHVLAAASQAGATATIAKPFALAEMLRLVASVVVPKANATQAQTA